MLGDHVSDSHMFTEHLLCARSWEYGMKKTNKIPAFVGLLLELREMNNKQINMSKV